MERTGASTARRLLSSSPVVVAGLALGVIGVGLLGVGWWGVSGESVVSRQLPYLASASIPGAAAVIAGAVLVTGGRRRRTDERVDVLYELLTEPRPTDEVDGAPDGSATGGHPGHRPGP